MQRNVVSVPPAASVAETLGMMDEIGVRFMPVLDAERRCLGLVSVFKISKFFFPSPEHLVDSRRVRSSLANLARVLKASIVNAPEPDREMDLLLMIGAMSPVSFAERLKRYPPEKLLVVVGDRQNIQELAVRERIRVVVVTGGMEVEPRIVQGARDNGVSLLISPHDTATTAMLCRTAITVSHTLTEEFLAFREDELLAELENTAAKSPFQAFPVLDDQRRVVGILSKSDFLRKVETKLILVDHNELSQAVRGADQVEILEIIDHHRLGALTTAQPILFRNEPVGSTSTIVADCFIRGNVELPKPVAGLLLAGLVSDTLNLTSPTTTARDGEVLRRLEQIAEVNATQFTEKLFSSGSLLTSKPAREAITTDCKEYAENNRTFSVAQIEELGFQQFWKRKDEVLAALRDYRSQHGYFFSALLVTDVVAQTSLLLLSGTETFLRQINHPEREPGIYELNNIVSRKKQLLPYLVHCLQQL
jgi:manganese-dependent inorganic pyrophosphatase